MMNGAKLYNSIDFMHASTPAPVCKADNICSKNQLVSGNIHTSSNAAIFSTSAVYAIFFYQRFISPLFGRHCIYIPTCSEYARQAFIRYGFRKGLWLTITRIARCHPFAQGGYDPLL